MFCKIEVLNNSTKFAGKKTVPESLLNKVAGLHACNFNKKRLQHRYFLINFVKLLRTPCLQDTSGQMLLFFGDRKSHFHRQNLWKYTPLLYFYCFFLSFIHVILLCKIISISLNYLIFWNQKMWFQGHFISSIYCVKVSKYGAITGPYLGTFHAMSCVNMN